MHWLIFALVAPLLWATVNHIDKYLLEKHFKSDGVGALILYSSLFAVIMLPVAYLIEPSLLLIDLKTILMLLLVGVITGFSIYAYLVALRMQEVSLIMPIFQTIPVFGFILGFFFLGELLTTTQMIAGAIIVFGAIIISLEIEEEERLRFRWKPLVLVLTSAILFALHDTLFKGLALETNFWTTVFWSNLGLLLFGVVIFISSRADRKAFLTTLRSQPVSIISLNFGSETATMIGNLTLSYATLLAPLALVEVVASYQPVFVFILGVIFTLFLPKFATERIKLRHLLHKGLAIGIMLIGTLLLYT
jgi:drug/metabolite transporter (DMT)-like permease